MPVITHLKSLQALEMALRVGSLKGAAAELAITPAAVGQRIRALESFLGTDLLLRGRSGLQPTAELRSAVADLKIAFSALDRVTQTLDFQRITEIHLVADIDWAELWLAPRLPAFQKQHPNILFCINGAGDVPARIGAPDCRITLEKGNSGDILFTDVHLPVCGPDNLRRVVESDDGSHMEGMPLLHFQAQLDSADRPGWVDWFGKYGQRREGADRGIHYRHVRLALEAARQEVGFLVCGLALVEEDLKLGQLVLPFPAHQYVSAPASYRLKIREPKVIRPQLQSFCDWLRAESALTAGQLETAVAC